MDAALSIALGYFAGSLSPSSLVGRVKKTDVRKSGTGNLGATNTMLVLGWGAGIFVMLFDLMKSFLSGQAGAVPVPRAQRRRDAGLHRRHDRPLLPGVSPLPGRQGAGGLRRVWSSTAG